jgi:hypothetical protein
MYPHQSPLLYKKSNNVFHHLRQKMLENFQYLNFGIKENEYSEDEYQKIFKKKQSEFTMPYSVNQFEGKLKSIQIRKIRRRGQLKDTTDDDVNLQKNESEYFDFKDLMSKIVSVEEKPKKILWRDLDKEKQLESILIYLESFNGKTESFSELIEDIKQKFEEGFFEKNKVLKWSNTSGKIYEIDSLIITSKIFYWNL